MKPSMNTATFSPTATKPAGKSLPWRVIGLAISVAVSGAFWALVAWAVLA